MTPFCISPNRDGPPLVTGSCNPPVQSSSYLTVGTGDANGQTAKSMGSVRYDAQLGDPTTLANEADVKFAFNVTDTRDQNHLSDYTGELQVNASIRITDKFNGASSTEPATTEDIRFPVTAPCTATSEATVGSSCSTTTTFNAIVPNAVLEGKRAIWQLGQVQVYDGGSDGASTTADNTPFMDEGIFVP